MRKHCQISFATMIAAWIININQLALSATYEVGPGKPYGAIGAVPWESLQAGDTVVIHWRTTPYKEKWVICRQGTAAAPITVRGIPGPAGELPIIDGNGATTRLQLDYWSETRGVVKIGGASIPPDTMPKYIVIENLDIRSARSSYSFTDDGGATQNYAANASAIYVEKGENITVRNCTMHDCGNGFFVASTDTAPSRNILVEGNYIYDNGNVNSAFEHNNYTAAIGIVFQFNRFGPTHSGSVGNCLKDRSAGLVVRYNWLEGGNRQLDLVDGEDSSAIRNDPSYHVSHVYGNILIEPNGAGNRQIVHYGGDSGATANYRKGTLYFYNNTVVSLRTDRTTLFRLSTNDEQCDARNNIVYVAAAAGNTLSIIDDTGIARLSHNWFKPGWVPAFFAFSGSVIDDGTSVVGSSPGFVDEVSQDYRLAAGSACLNAGAPLNSAVLPAHDLLYQYMKHQSGEARPNDGFFDIGAYEQPSGPPADLVITTSSLPDGTVDMSYSAMVQATGGVKPYSYSVSSGALPDGLALDSGTGEIFGTPATEQTAVFTVAVVDSQNPVDSDARMFSITVNASPIDPLVITTASLPNAKRNKNYSQTLQATGGMVPYSWSIASGSLPSGLMLNTATGVISGRATTLGNWNFVVQVTDSQPEPALDQQALSIRVTR